MESDQLGQPTGRSPFALNSFYLKTRIGELYQDTTAEVSRQYGRSTIRLPWWIVPTLDEVFDRSVSDAQSRVVQIYGLLRFIHIIPYFAKMSRGTSLTDEALWNFPWSVVGNEVLQCSVEAAANSSRIDAGLML
ncbi:hypothetical protein BBP40_003255 [Aspergillus hancockii]|nr:hypothetical protein BBP40_003255 [Aspergillus hancockii]